MSNNRASILLILVLFVTGFLASVVGGPLQGWTLADSMLFGVLFGLGLTFLIGGMVGGGFDPGGLVDDFLPEKTKREDRLREREA